MIAYHEPIQEDRLPRAESGHKDKLEDIYDTVAFPEAW